MAKTITRKGASVKAKAPKKAAAKKAKPVKFDEVAPVKKAAKKKPKPKKKAEAAL